MRCGFAGWAGLRAEVVSTDREPSREFVHWRCGQVGQQLREIELRVHVVAAAGAGQAGQYRRRSGGCKSFCVCMVRRVNASEK